MDGGARAADMPYNPPPMMVQPAPMMPVVEDFSGWYLRGDVGVGMSRLEQFEWTRNPSGGATNFAIETFSLGDSAFVGLGVGYEYNNWLRFDFTGEYRSKAKVYAFGSYTTACPGGGTCQDIYDANFKSWVFLMNAYADLGTWWCITPFIGAGIGGAYNKFESLSDFGPQTGGRGFGRNSAEWDLAWALHAGFAYNVTKAFKVELGYRYLNMGSVTDQIDCVGGCAPDSYKLKNISSHDFKLGLRWVCCDDERPQRYMYTAQPSYVPPPPPPQQQVIVAPPPVYQAPPVYQQPQPVYQQPQYAPPPPPVYQQPPLMRKG
jgi:opacity protein-like surface antigen